MGKSIIHNLIFQENVYSMCFFYCRKTLTFLKNIIFIKLKTMFENSIASIEQRLETFISQFKIVVKCSLYFVGIFPSNKELFIF